MRLRLLLIVVISFVYACDCMNQDLFVGLSTPAQQSTLFRVLFRSLRQAKSSQRVDCFELTLKNDKLKLSSQRPEDA